MILFLQVLFTMFIAEMGDKTQLLMIAMTSRYKLRDILIGSALSILTLNAIAVALGSIISQLIPTWLIKLVAASAFFYFAWSTLHGEEEDEEESAHKEGNPILIVFGTFFLAELGDKTQLTAITFAANGGISQAISVWLACSVGLFLADLVGMMVGHLIEQKMPAGFLDKLAFVIFAVFGVVTYHEGFGLLLPQGIALVPVVALSLLFVCLCLMTRKKAGSVQK